ncbi:hypothetical protein H7F50_16885 [Novosphingobium flavum]|uniref:hypothetical protein n=1 Tax=Novosphingobium aerophilum TaxID=2839843 RepID=UPI001799319D|nr:hypothetical protein [Novosphingobium aerophilum]MBC2663425.1 hypothetical protein [Novosphingobium aerophilum]
MRGAEPLALPLHVSELQVFAKQTVFVVGAGASAELNLPTGQELKKQISAALSYDRGYYIEFSDHRISDAINEDASSRDERNISNYIEACDLIRSALPAAISIDNFIDAHQGNHYVEFCGKLAIVKAIWEAEKSSKLSKFCGSAKQGISSVSQTWLIPFF